MGTNYFAPNILLKFNLFLHKFSINFSEEFCWLNNFFRKTPILDFKYSITKTRFQNGVLCSLKINIMAYISWAWNVLFSEKILPSKYVFLLWQKFNCISWQILVFIEVSKFNRRKIPVKITGKNFILYFFYFIVTVFEYSTIWTDSESESPTNVENVGFGGFRIGSGDRRARTGDE